MNIKYNGCVEWNVFLITVVSLTCGLTNIHTIDTTQCKTIIRKRIEDIAMHNWYTDISMSTMCVMYRTYKKNLSFEKYLLLSNNRDRINLTKFRCSNSRIPVYNQIYLYDSELCTLCNLNICGDEYHYLLICPFFAQGREQYVKRYYYHQPSLLKLLGCTKKRTLIKLAKFITIIINHFWTFVCKALVPIIYFHKLYLL